MDQDQDQTSPDNTNQDAGGSTDSSSADTNQSSTGTSDAGSGDASQSGTDAGETDTGSGSDQGSDTSNTAGDDTDVEPLEASGEGEVTEVEVAANGSLSLQGLTRATFNGGSFRTTNVRTTAGTDCAGCSGRACVHVEGTLVTNYRVTTTVTLPRVEDFPDLTPCQKDRVRDAINNVLSPHEQQHVAAFSAYNGSTSQSFDTTLCRSEFNGFIRGMVSQEEGARRATVQAASDALDPFNFDVDLDCTD